MIIPIKVNMLIKAELVYKAVIKLISAIPTYGIHAKP